MLAALLVLLAAQADVEREDADPGYVRVNNPAFPLPIVPTHPIDRGPQVERADLEPYFAFGRLAGARWAWEDGRLEKAKKLLEREGDQPPVRYLRALVALKGADYPTAAAEFQSLSDLYPPMRDRCLIQAAWAWEGLRDFDSAARLYEKVGKGSRQYPDARLGLARARRWMKDLTGAKAAVAEFLERPPPLWGRDLGAEALLTLADIHAVRRDDKAEKEALLKLWSSHPMSPQAAKAEARLSNPAAAASVEQNVTRAEALIDAHRNVQGITILEPLVANLKLPEPLACRAHFALGKGQRKQRAHAKAVALLGPVVKKCTDADLRARALFILGFSRTIVEPENAAATYELLASEYPGHAYADDALFSAAEVRVKQGEQDQGLQLLAQIVERYPAGDFVGEALFKRFWILRRANDLNGAGAALDQLLARFANADDSFEVERASYWRARLLAAEDNDAALALYEKLATEHPTTYYGLASREKLDPARVKVLLEAPLGAKAVDPFPLFAGPVANDQSFAAAVELLRLGLYDLVPSEILAIDRTTLTADSLRLMVHVLALAGKEREAHGLARIWLRKDLGRPIDSETRPLFVIAYPNAFRPEVEKACEAADKLDPNLLQALMREESALDPKVHSWAGAIGLTQLMPSTAAEVAAGLKLKRPTTEDLLEPELNLQLGGRYLADLLKRARGVKHYAIASYNAGEGAVRRWRQAAPQNEIDEWVEEIPLTETRLYVKRVLRSYNTYQLLYPPPPAALPSPAARR